MEIACADGLRKEVMSDEVRFVRHAIDHPGSAVCRFCGATAPVPTTEPWAIVNGQAIPPDCLVSMRCPHCRRRIYLDPADESRREQDEDSDALMDEDDG